MIEGMLKEIGNMDMLYLSGEIEEIIGHTVKARGYLGEIGSVCTVRGNNNGCIFEVVGFKENTTYMMPMGEIKGITPRQKVISTGKKIVIDVGPQMLGRVFDCLGRPLDGKGPFPHSGKKREIFSDAPEAMKRKRITDILSTGVKAVDSMLTVGKGQRIGIFSGSGVGKSTLLGMLIKNNRADTNVICLVGERGREVKEFIDDCIGEEGMKRSAVIVSTPDQPPLARIRAAFTATTVSEYFREQGKDVALFLDSLTRMAMAQRELGLSVGEPPTAKGYPPSVYGLLASLLERAGHSDAASITGFYTVLVEGDDMNEPVSDHARSILDGHICLDRGLFNKGRKPAIDVLVSLSRLMNSIVDRETLELADKARKILSTYHEVEDMINIGAYKKGSNPEIDYAIEKSALINNFLSQDFRDNAVPFEESVAGLKEIIG